MLFNSLCLRNVLQELVADLWFTTELAGLSGKLLLRLGCERWVDDETVDEEEDVIPDLRLLELDTSLVLLVDNLLELFANLVCDVVYMCAARGR